LTERHGYRIAVIMNEFGDTAVSSSCIIDEVDHLLSSDQDIEGGVLDTYVATVIIIEYCFVSQGYQCIIS
jgi:hypothetical protein